MKLNAARVKALVLTGLTMGMAWVSDPQNAALLDMAPRWLRALVAGAVAFYGIAFVSSTEVKTGQGKAVTPPVTLLVVGLALVLGACPAGCPNPPPVVGKVAHCSSQAVQDHAVDLLPRVNSCLVGSDFMSCLGGLIQPAIGITEEVVVCLVRAQGDQYHAAVASNPNDDVSALAAKHADQYADGWSFAE